MARHLLKRQMKILDTWTKDNANNGPNFFDTDALPLDTWEQLISINDFETIHHAIDRYLHDKYFEIEREKDPWLK